MTLSSAQLCKANEESKKLQGGHGTLIIDRTHSVDTFNEVGNYTIYRINILHRN